MESVKPFDLDLFMHRGQGAAQRLLGRPVILAWGCDDPRYGEGSGKTLWGACYRWGDCDVIELNPQLMLDPDRAFEILTHEIGHLRDHPTRLVDRAKVSEERTHKSAPLEESHPILHEARESRADTWASHLQEWASERAPNGDVIAKLEALATWPGKLKRSSRRWKLTEALGKWDKSYHDLAVRRRVYKAANKLLVPEPIVNSEDLRLYRETMQLMGYRP